MPEGAILLDRMYFEKPEWLAQAKESGFSRATAWLDMLALCNQKATTATVRGIQMNLERGECARSKLGLASRWGRSWSWITATLSSWEKDGRIQIRKCDNEMTVIFITNFDSWQTGMASMLIAERDQIGTKSGAERDQIGTEREKEREKYREPRGEGEGEEEPTPGAFPEQTSDAAMLDFGRTWAGEMAIGTPPMDQDWVVAFVAWINGRNSMPHSWRRLMVAKWRKEWPEYQLNRPGRSPAKPTKGNGEAAWKKLRALDDKIKEIEIQITGFENTAPELAERLEADLKKLRAERKAIADE